MLEKIKKHTLIFFMVRLFIVTAISSVIVVFLIYYYNEYQIATNIENVIKKQKDTFENRLSNKNIEYVKKSIEENKNIINLEIYNNSKEKILDIKKRKDDFILKNVLNHFEMISKDTTYKLFPISDNEVYIYFQTQIKIKNDFYYINILLQLDDKTINLIRQDMQASIFIVLMTMGIVFLFIFPIVYSQYKSILEKKDELLKSNIDTLISLGNAIAKKDSDTSEHNYRVTYYSIKLAQALELSRDEIKTIIKGAFLHDIGKIAISDNILLKPGELNEKEFTIMKTHVNHGVDIVKNISWLQDAQKVIQNHHEKVDGSGYPNGLTKDDIPIEARIFAVVDVFDALTSKRPYKEAFDIEKSINIIKSGINVHFDEKVIYKFEEIYEKIYYDILDISAQELEDIFSINIEPYFNVKIE